VPVTAKLSRAFYDRLGEQVAQELVEWFNMVDAAYRLDLHQLNETNFARFDSRVEQRFAEADLRIERRFAEFEQRMAAFEVRIEQRMAAFEGRIEQRLAKVEERMSAFELRIESRLGVFESTLRRELATQLRWMIGLWMTTMVALLGVLWRLG
jgi:hypothetical protein